MLDIGKCQGAWRADWADGIGNESQRVALAINEPAKFGDVRGSVGENIVISSPPPQVDEFSTGLGIRKVLSRYCGLACARCETTSVFCTWSHKSFLFIRHGIVEEIADGQGSISNLATDANHTVSSRRISAIAPEQAKSPIVMQRNYVKFPELTVMIWKKESRFIGNEGLFGKFRLGIAGEPESAGESSNHKCCEGGNSYAVTLNELPRTVDVSGDDGSVTGWLVFGGSIGFGILLVVYAAFKERRRGAFNAHKNHH